MIRVGLVGYGMAGKVFHAPVISAVEGLELAAVVERSARNAEAAYPGIATYTSLEAMLADASIELVIIATTNETHSPLAHQALAAGRHVVVDKPVGVSSSEIAGLMDEAEKQGKSLIPFHNRRWDSDFQTLRNLLQEGSLGAIVSLESAFDRWRPHPRLQIWRENGSPGTGLHLDLGTHLADQAITLFGLPQAVSAEVLTERPNGVTVDSFTLRLRYPRLGVTLAANCLAALPRPRYAVRGTRGNYVKWGLDPQEERLKQTGRIVEPNWGMEPPSAWGTLAIDAEGSMITSPVKPIPGDYRLYYAQVRDAILGIAPPPVLAQDALNVAKILEWAQQSSDERHEIPCTWTSTGN
jgi:scyllo-inositol 2-dehydrogenase (NADP+)